MTFDVLNSGEEQAVPFPLTGLYNRPEPVGWTENRIMPLPLVPIAIGAGALSVGAMVHSTLKKRKWQKLHNEALAKAQQTEKRTLQALEQMNRQAENLGERCVNELDTLRQAAESLERARVMERNPIPELVEIPGCPTGNLEVHPR